MERIVKDAPGPNRSRAGVLKHAGKPAIQMSDYEDIGDIEVIAPNFKYRLSGVTSTLERVVPVQGRSLRIAALGPALSVGVPRIRFLDLLRLRSLPQGKPWRIWHARRNVEMLVGLVLRHILRAPLRLVFTSASQRRHTRWTKFLIGKMDAVISTSSKTASYLEVPSVVVRHGIDASRFRPTERKSELLTRLGLPHLKWIGCFGRIRHQKGTDVFVDAMIRIMETRPDVGAIVLGRAVGKHRRFLEELKRKVRESGLSSRILFPREVAPSETPDWYAALDLFVAPQRWEGFGVTPLEAMATGVPVVATTVGAFPELVAPDSTGALIPPSDPSAMATAIARLIDDDTLRSRLGSQARIHVMTHFTLESEAAGINAVYHSLK